jgi:hypothetical protein
MENSAHERSPHNKENNLTYDDESNWLHRNDAYQRQHIAGSSKRATVVPLGQKQMEPIVSIIGDIAQGIFNWLFYIVSDILIVIISWIKIHSSCRASHPNFRG